MCYNKEEQNVSVHEEKDCCETGKNINDRRASKKHQGFLQEKERKSCNPDQDRRKNDILVSPSGRTFKRTCSKTYMYVT